MALKIEQGAVPGVFVIKPDVFKDPRGFFLETYHYKKYAAAGFERPFVQDNHSRSSRGVLRGLHYQLQHPQCKLVFAVRGEIFDVAVDIRRGSPTFGGWFGQVLSEENKYQMFVPQGVAHGFCVLSETADVMYKCTEVYHPEDDRGILWSDPAIGITWPLQNPLISDRDSRHPLLRAMPDELLPAFSPIGT